VVLYTLISVFYRLVLCQNENLAELKNTFDQICIQVNKFTDMIPMSFVLGFYVSIIVSRWWQQYMSIPWPDRMMMCLNIYVRHHTLNEHDMEKCVRCEDARSLRRTMVRWLNLGSVLTFRDVSQSVRDRFPTLDHITSAGFMTKSELDIYENTKTVHLKYWIPFIWFGSLASKARTSNLINSDFALKTIIDEMNTFRGCCGMLQSWDWISIPLVYTQVVTVAVYGFFISCLFGRQYLDLTPELSASGFELDLYVPAYTILQFFFYMGWLKVAEQLINPFGNDEDDFDMNLIVDRNLEVSFLAIDNLFSVIPDNQGPVDIWEDKEFAEAPYTAEAAKYKKAPYLGSTQGDAGFDDAEFLPLDSLYELTAEKDNQGMLPNFLDSMMSMRSRGSTRRRLISSNHNYGSDSVMDSGLDVNYQHQKLPTSVSRDQYRSRETVIESSSTLHRPRREIVNPYMSSRTPQPSVKSEGASRMASVTVENEINETTLLIPTTDDVNDDHTDGILSPIDSKRIIDIVKPDGELQTVEVPAPPGVEPVDVPTPTPTITTTTVAQLVPINEVDKKQA